MMRNLNRNEMKRLLGGQQLILCVMTLANGTMWITDELSDMSFLSAQYLIDSQCYDTPGCVAANCVSAGQPADIVNPIPSNQC